MQGTIIVVGANYSLFDALKALGSCLRGEAGRLCFFLRTEFEMMAFAARRKPHMKANMAASKN